MTKILLVEDDKSLREIYGVRLLAEGYDIVSAGDGEEALAMAIKERPELIVSDVMMPKISGFDMLDILRSTTETRDIKVIMMTALSSEDQRQRGEQLGADRYLVKSQVGIEDVVRTVHDVLGDIPAAATATPQQAFGTPPPSAVPQPAPTAPPRETVVASTPPVPTPQPAPLPPAASVVPVAPVPPVTQPVAVATPSVAPSAPEPATTPTPPVAVTPVSTAPAAPPPPASFTQSVDAPSSGLPQPTAPFSGQRPASLGERVIQPLNEPASQPDLSSLLEQELAQSEASTPLAAPTPNVPSVDTTNNPFLTPPTQ